MEYDIGQGVEIFIEDIRDDNGDVVDPDTLSLVIVKPNGTTIDKAIGELEHVATGHYRYAVTPEVAADAGVWDWRFQSTDPDTAKEGSFTVRRSVVLGGRTPRLVGGTCAPWAETGDVTTGPAADYAFDSGLLEDGIQVASDILYELTRRQWPGECEDSLRPCGYGTSIRQLHQDPATGYIAGMAWCGCQDSRRCGCTWVSEMRLPGFPVRSILSVKIDGAVLPAARYRVDDRRWLVYLPEHPSDRRQGWPCCQRIDLPDTEHDTWSITYTYGMGPPTGGVKAAARLGAQLALAWSPEHHGACELPQRVTNITRQGVSMTVLDPMTLISEGRTGLVDVDLWVTSVVNGLANRPATVHIPTELPRVRRTSK